METNKKQAIAVMLFTRSEIDELRNKNYFMTYSGYINAETACLMLRANGYNQDDYSTLFLSVKDNPIKYVLALFEKGDNRIYYLEII